MFPQIGCLSSDNQIFFWSIRDYTRLSHKEAFDRLITGIEYLSGSDLWAIIDFDNCVVFYQMKTRMHHEILAFNELLKVQMHSDKITGMKEVCVLLISSLI